IKSHQARFGGFFIAQIQPWHSPGFFMRHARRETTESSSERAPESIGCCSVGLVFLGDGALSHEEAAMSNVIPFNYQGQPVRFNSDGWINATEIAKRHGKRLDVWLKTAETQAYLESLARHLNTT